MKEETYYQVRDDIPAPPLRKKHGEWVRIAAGMELGNHVLVKDENQYMALYRAMRRLGYEVTKQTTSEGKIVWRVK